MAQTVIHISKITYELNSKWRLYSRGTLKILSLNTARKTAPTTRRPIVVLFWKCKTVLILRVYERKRETDGSAKEADETAKRECAETLGKPTGVSWRKRWTRGTTMGVNQVGVLACGWISSIIRRRETTGAPRKPSCHLYHSAPRRNFAFAERQGREGRRGRFGVQLDARRDAARLSGWTLQRRYRNRVRLRCKFGAGSPLDNLTG